MMNPRMAAVLLAFAGVGPLTPLRWATQASIDHYQRLVDEFGLSEVENALQLAHTTTEPNLQAAEAILKQRFSKPLMLETDTVNGPYLELTSRPIVLLPSPSFHRWKEDSNFKPSPKTTKIATRADPKRKAKRKAAKAARKKGR